MVFFLNSFFDNQERCLSHLMCSLCSPLKKWVSPGKRLLSNILQSINNLFNWLRVTDGVCVAYIGNDHRESPGFSPTEKADPVMKVVLTQTHLNLICQIVYSRRPVTKEVNSLLSKIN